MPYTLYTSLPFDLDGHFSDDVYSAVADDVVSVIDAFHDGEADVVDVFEALGIE